MTTAGSHATVQPGQPAPDFTLPTVPDEGFVSLADFRGRSPLLLVLLRTIGR
jgi:peroxiredoxin